MAPDVSEVIDQSHDDVTSPAPSLSSPGLPSPRRRAKPGPPPVAGVAFIDAEGILQASDETFAGLVRLAPAQVPGCDLGSLLDPADADSLRSTCAALIAGEATAAVLDVILTPAAAEPDDHRDVRLTCAPGPAPYVVLVADDTTEARLAVQQSRFLLGLLRDTSAGATPELALAVALRRLCTTGGWDAVQLWTVEPDATLVCNRSWYASTQGFKAWRQLSLDAALPAGVGVPGIAWLTAAEADLGHLGQGDPDLRAASIEPTGSLEIVAIPVRYREEVVAVLELVARSARPPHSRRFAALAADHLAPGLALRAAQRDAAAEHARVLAREAHRGRDPLTGLVGEVLLIDRLFLALARAERNDTGVAIYDVDLDGFGTVNDKYGSAVADVILIEAGRRLADAIRSTDTCARVESDAFVLICEDVDSAVAAYPAADRVVAALARPYVLPDGGTVAITASVGAAVTTGGQEGAAGVLSRARRALQTARHTGGGHAVVDASES